MLSDAATGLLQTLVREEETRHARGWTQQHSLSELYRLAETLAIAEPVGPVQELLDHGFVELVRGDFGGLPTSAYRLCDLDVARAYSQEPVVTRPRPLSRPSALADEKLKVRAG